MNVSNMGLHVTTGPRNGYGEFAQSSPAVVVVNNTPGAFDELPDNTIKIYRQQHTYGDVYPDFDSQPLELQGAIAEYWWPMIKTDWAGVNADYFQPNNEIAGYNDRNSLTKFLAYEERLMELANSDNIKLSVGSFAGGSPTWELWVELVVPFLTKANQLGHIYNRHAYGGVSVDYPWLMLGDAPANANSNRPFMEAEYLNSRGINTPIVISEAGTHAGLVNGNPSQTLSDFFSYEDYSRDYDNIVGIAFWTAGDYLGVNIQHLLPDMTIHLEANLTGGMDKLQRLLEQPSQVGCLESFLVSSSESKRQLNLNKDAALQRAIYADGFVPFQSEHWGSYEGRTYAMQGSRNLNTNDCRIYYADTSNFGNVMHVSYQVGETDYDCDSSDCPDGLNFEHLPTECRHFTQGFGDNPSWYERFNLPGHSGVDIACPRGTQVTCGLTSGTVATVGNNPNGYGRYVIVRSGEYNVYYAHFDQILVAQGAAVTKNTVLGLVGSTGNSTGPHLHLEVRRVDGNGLEGWPHGIINVEDCIYALPLRVKPPQGTTVDLFPYVVGDGVQYMVDNANGGQEQFQSQRNGGNYYQVKNTNWERFKLDANFIYRTVDVSPGGGRFYKLTNVSGGDKPWVKRHMQVGESFSSTGHVQFYLDDTHGNSSCTESSDNSGIVVDTILFLDKYDTYTSRGGVTLRDVIKLKWVEGGELYFYARNYGLVAWEREHQDPHTPAWSSISHVFNPGERSDLVRRVVCGEN